MTAFIATVALHYRWEGCSGVRFRFVELSDNVSQKKSYCEI